MRRTGTMSNPDIKLHRLPVFDNHYGRPDHWSGLQVDGLVAEPRTFSAADLEALATTTLTEDFHCQEGWSVADQKWEGASLAEILQVVRPLPDARYAEVSAADYSVVIPLSDASDALLASKLNGDTLPEDHGGPCRLVLVGANCYTSIKWVDHIRLTANQGAETAQHIAAQRNRESKPN
jgi:DMSO/TMAO reductase YedYZ molybdopterin-dependent catalytic subunit